MTKRTPGSTAKLRQGTQDLLERRGMASPPTRLAPEPSAGSMSYAAAGYGVGEAFRHGGRDAAGATAHAAPAMHAELKGHRHRGAEKHSAH
ncbi:hypothetical protein DR950_23585 [Kitasatospora xanthocidica]|uniref:Uncharacterized protein n=1 Tax=Kitasatospora xanthocidica TaxID=83382 RepID=A0A372ZWZ9_9ACTN|nr:MULTISPECIES: hypothetical protein [Streptomycetaceae]OKI08603.1 hypothetical protein AMK13_08940 [Streptomyces sp. CB02056]RGD60373.1 hypothetical protein DR950_23585 [Kitasatospora xanthocidica]